MKIIRCLLLSWASIALYSCGSIESTAGFAAGATAALGRMPSHDVEQTYYVGVFDARNEQVPPSLYRITVRGQASFISATKFASGWVPAGLIDSLGTRIRFDDEGNLELSGDDKLNDAQLETGRGLMMFGPEGFRRAPRDHRLVIVMGSDPSGYFQAIEETLGDIASAKKAAGSDVRAANQALITAMLDLSQQRDLIESARSELATKMPLTEGAR